MRSISQPIGYIDSKLIMWRKPDAWYLAICFDGLEVP